MDKDIVHTQQTYSMVSDLACLGSILLGRKAFVTDHGGGSPQVLNRRLPLLPRYRAAFCYSAFMARFQAPELRSKTCLIKGGIDQASFFPDPSVPRRNHLLFVGRLLPHKGVDYLIRAFRLWGRAGWRLRIVGRPYDEAYFSELRQIAGEAPVDFIQSANDESLLNEYRTAKITILPSVHTDSRGNHTPIPEQMGLTLLEAQSCGTPVICSDAGAMPEFVSDGITGRITRQNSVESLAAAFEELAEPTFWKACSEAARPYSAQFSMDQVARRHLEAYASL